MGNRAGSYGAAAAAAGSLSMAGDQQLLRSLVAAEREREGVWVGVGVCVWTY